MGHLFSILRGLGLGAGLMYLFDPQQGRRRRALLGDQVTRMTNDLEDALCVGMRDFSHRTQGLVAETTSKFRHDGASDQVIAERVRSKAGRAVSHPRPIHIEVHDGHVTVSGPILAPEVDRLLCAVKSVRGVTGVDNRLEIHEQPGNHPALQGGATRTGERPELWQENWSPATRLLLGTMGGIALTPFLRRSGMAALAIGLVGVGLVANGTTRESSRRSQSGRDQFGRSGQAIPVKSV